MVTKSGGDRWRGRTTFTWLGDATQTQNIDDESAAATGSGPRPTRSTSSPTSTSAAAARSSRTSCASSASFRDWRVHVNVPAAFSTAGARQDRHHVGPGQPHLPGQRQEPAHRLLLAASTTRSRTASSAPQQSARAGVDQQRRRRVRHLPGAVELGHHQQRSSSTRGSAATRSSSRLYLNGNDQTLLDSATGIRCATRPPSTSDCRDRYQANATGQQVHRRGARRPPRVQVRLRSRALADREPRCTAATTSTLTYSSATSRSADRDAVRHAVLLQVDGGRHGAVRCRTATRSSG